MFATCVRFAVNVKVWFCQQITQSIILTKYH